MTYLMYMRKKKSELVKMVGQLWGDEDPPEVVDNASKCTRSDLCNMLVDANDTGARMDLAESEYEKACSRFRESLNAIEEHLRSKQGEAETTTGAATRALPGATGYTPSSHIWQPKDGDERIPQEKQRRPRRVHVHINEDGFWEYGTQDLTGRVLDQIGHAIDSGHDHGSAIDPGTGMATKKGDKR